MWVFLILQLFGLNWYGDWALWYYLVSLYFLTLAMHAYGLGRSIFEWAKFKKDAPYSFKPSRDCLRFLDTVLAEDRF